MELEPVRGAVRPEWGRPIVIGGKPYEKGISGFAGSEVEYDVKGLYGEFSALAVVNDGSPDDGRLEFIVSGDGRELWRSGPLKKADGPKPVKIGVACVRRLVLRVADANGGGQGEDRFRGLQGDWIEARIAVLVQ
jgi:alpha-galactosidase